MTDLYYADSSGKDIGIFSDSVNLDCDINSGDYDFELTVRDSIDGKLQKGNIIYIPGTEIGGIIQDILPSDTEGVSVYGGQTWRGLYLKEVIEPPSGQDYRIVTGDLNYILSALFNGKFGSIVAFDSACGKVISNYQIDRHVYGTWLIDDILDKYGYRIDIRYDNSGAVGVVREGFVPITDYSRSIELSDELGLKYTYTNKHGYNAIIGAGKGELKDRAIVKYYADANGNISQNQTITGLNANTYFYDYSSAESEEDLRTKTKKKLKELVGVPQVDFNSKDFTVLVSPGDIIGGPDATTGMTAAVPVESSVIKLSGGKLTVEHKFKTKAKET